MTKTEKELQRLSEALAALVERTGGSQSDIEYVEGRVARLETAIDKLRDQISTLQTQIAVLQASQADLVKRWDESDRRRWTVYGVMLAAILTFAANLILLFLKR